MSEKIYTRQRTKAAKNYVNLVNGNFLKKFPCMPSHAAGRKGCFQNAYSSTWEIFVSEPTRHADNAVPALHFRSYLAFVHLGGHKTARHQFISLYVSPFNMEEGHKNARTWRTPSNLWVVKLLQQGRSTLIACPPIRSNPRVPPYVS